MDLFTLFIPHGQSHLFLRQMINYRIMKSQSLVTSYGSLSSLFLDLSGAILPPLLQFVHKCVSDPPEAAAHLSQVTGHLAGLLPDLP